MNRAYAAALSIGLAALAGHAQGFPTQPDSQPARWGLSNLGSLPGAEPPECDRANCLVGGLGEGAALLGRYSRISGRETRRFAQVRARSDALREALAGLGSAAVGRLALAFEGKGSGAAGDNFAFRALPGWSTLLARSHAAVGPRFGAMLYNAAGDSGSQLVWSGSVEADARSVARAAGAPVAPGSIGDLEPLSAARESPTRTIIFLNKGKASVMVLRNPAAKK